MYAYLCIYRFIRKSETGYFKRGIWNLQFPATFPPLSCHFPAMQVFSVNVLVNVFLGAGFSDVIFCWRERKSRNIWEAMTQHFKCCIAGNCHFPATFLPLSCKWDVFLVIFRRSKRFPARNNSIFFRAKFQSACAQELPERKVTANNQMKQVARVFPKSAKYPVNEYPV